MTTTNNRHLHQEAVATERYAQQQPHNMYVSRDVKAYYQRVITMNMKVAMIVRGIRQSDFARALGMSYSYVSLKLNGNQNWTERDVAHAARLLNIPVDRLTSPTGIISPAIAVDFTAGLNPAHFNHGEPGRDSSRVTFDKRQTEK